MFLKVENKSQWRNLLDKALFKTFFHSPEWENFLEKEFRWIRFEHYAWRNEALLSVARCRMLWKEKLVSHPFCEYGGSLPLKEKVDFEAFIIDFQQFFGKEAKIKFHPYILKNLGAEYYSPTHSRPASAGLRGSDSFAPSGTMPKLSSNPSENNTPPLVSFWIEDFSKKSKEDLWKNFRKTLRNELEQDAENIVHIEECANREDIEAFYALYLATVRRHKNIPLLFSFFEFFHGSEFAKIFLAKRFGEVIGGSIFLFYPPFIHYFINASGQKFRSAHIGHKILWHVMQKYVGYPIPHISGSYDYFDLGGTRRDSALEVFKRGWGAKEYPISAIGNNRDKGGASSLRNILGFVPAAVMERAAPFALWVKV